MTKQIAIASDMQAAGQAEDAVLDELARRSYSEAATFAIRLSLEEALANAIRHGNRCDPSKPVKVHFDVNDRRAVVTITDQGEGFDLHDVPDPTADENLEKPCGRGIMLMRAYMDDVRFNEKGNEVRLTKCNS